MQLADLLTRDRVASVGNVASKKRALEYLSGLIAGGQGSLTPNEVFDSLLSRERLGSTGLGHGVALPHGRVANIDRTIGAFVRLDQGVDFDAVDGDPVDLLFALLVPEQSTDEHLEFLAQLAEMFSTPELREELRRQTDPELLYDILRSWKKTD